MKFFKVIVFTIFLLMLFVGNTTEARIILKNGMSPLEVNMVNTTFENNKLIFDVIVKNNTKDFISGVNSTLSLYKGDSLKKEGDLFGDLDLVYNDISSIKSLSPNSEIAVRLIYNLPASIEAGSYFAKIGMTDREMEYFGNTYTNKAINITGKGGFIGGINAFIRTKHGDQSLMSGQLLKIGDSISIVIPLKDNNSKLKKILESQKLYGVAEIREIAFNNNILKKIPKKELKISNDEIVYTVNPWEGMPTGTMTIEMTIVDKDNIPVANTIFARWYINDRVARVSSIVTKTNYYPKKNNLDLKVVCDFVGFDNDDKLAINTEIEMMDNKKYNFKKVYVFNKNNSEEVTFDFSNEVVDKNSRVKLIKASIFDEKKNEVKDEYTRKMVQDADYVNGNIFTLSFVYFSQQKVLVMLSALILIFIMIIFVLIFKSIKIMKVLIFLLIGSAFFMASSAFAACSAPSGTCGSGAFTPNEVWAIYGSYTEGNVGTCPINITVEDVYAHMKCDSCLNGVTGKIGLEIQKADGSDFGESCIYLGDPGHRWSWKEIGDPLRYNPPGPYILTKEINTPGKYKYRLVLNSSGGCKCFADSWHSDWINVECKAPYTCTGTPPAGSTLCPDATTGLTKNIAWNKVTTCTGAAKCSYTKKATCGPANDSSDGYETKEDLIDAGLCGNGSTVANFNDSMAGLPSGAKWKWDCTKTGYDTVHCSADKRGACTASLSGPFDSLAKACEYGSFNSVHLVGGILKWTCGTDDHDDWHVGSFISDDATLGGFVSKDGTPTSTSCECTPQYAYNCIDGGTESCTGKCGQTVIKYSIPTKIDTACFPGVTLPVTEAEHNCPDSQVQCGPCGTTNGGSDTINETN